MTVAELTGRVTAALVQYKDNNQPIMKTPGTPRWGVYDRIQDIECVFKELFSEFDKYQAGTRGKENFKIFTASGAPGSGKTTSLQSVYDGFNHLHQMRCMINGQKTHSESEMRDCQYDAGYDVLSDRAFHDIWEEVITVSNGDLMDYFEEVVPIFIDCSKKARPVVTANINEKANMGFWLGVRIINAVLRQNPGSLVEELWPIRNLIHIEGAFDILDKAFDTFHNINNHHPPQKRCFVLMIDELMQLADEDTHLFLELNQKNRNMFTTLIHELPTLEEIKPNRLGVSILTNIYEGMMEDMHDKSSRFAHALPLTLLSHDVSNVILSNEFERMLARQVQAKEFQRYTKNASSNNNNKPKPPIQREKSELLVDKHDFYEYWNRYVEDGEYWRLTMQINGLPRAFYFLSELIQEDTSRLFNLLTSGHFDTLTTTFVDHVVSKLVPFKAPVPLDVLKCMIQQRGPIKTVYDKIVPGQFDVTWNDLRTYGILKCSNGKVPTFLPFRFTETTLKELLDSNDDDVKRCWEELTQFKCLVNNHQKGTLFEKYFGYQQLLACHFLDSKELSLGDFFGLHVDLNYRISENLSKIMVKVQRICYIKYLDTIQPSGDDKNKEDDSIFDKLCKHRYITHSASDKWVAIDAVMLLDVVSDVKKYLRMWIQLRCRPGTKCNPLAVDTAYDAMEKLVAKHFKARDDVIECFVYAGFGDDVDANRKQYYNSLNNGTRILILNNDILDGCYAFGSSFLLTDGMLCFFLFVFFFFFVIGVLFYIALHIDCI